MTGKSERSATIESGSLACAEEVVLQANPLVRRVALISCSKEKLSVTASARELYTGRNFKAAIAYAEATCCTWAVLSAKYGLVMKDRELAPYDQRMPTNEAARLGWARRVNSAVVRTWCEAGFFPGPEVDEYGLHSVRWDPTRPGVPSFVLLAAEEYRIAFEGRLVTEGHCLELSIEVPMRGLFSGQQYQWLKANTPARAA